MPGFSGGVSATGAGQFQAFRTTQATIAAGTSNPIGVTLPVPFGDANYTISVTVDDTTPPPTAEETVIVNAIGDITDTGFVAFLTNLDPTNDHTYIFHVIVVHD